MSALPSTSLPAFSLKDAAGQSRSFPNGRPALLCFVKEDCPTCDLSMPLIEAAHVAFSGEVDVWAVGQDQAGNRILVDRHSLSTPMLDDSELRVSFDYELDTVPTIILADAGGVEISRFVGFGREDWRDLYARLAKDTGLAIPAVDIDAYPESRPGCGSRSVEPGIADRLEAEAAGSPIRARRIEIGEMDDPDEFMFDQGFTDGLPVLLPTPERVIRMLRGTSRSAREVLGLLAPNFEEATVEKVAINAVMAGCKPEYLPVVIAAVEALCSEEFNAHGVSATTWGATPVMVVNGPVRHRIGMSMGQNALGQGNRANATIGRALRLVLRNVGGSVPGGSEKATLGHPGRFTMCFAEYEERSPWEPWHVERGFKPEESAVTLFASDGPRGLSDQTSRTARGLGAALGLACEAAWGPRQHGSGDILLVVCLEHADTLARDGWSKADLRNRMQEVTSRRHRDLLPNEELGAGTGFRASGDADEDASALERLIPKFRSTENINIVVAGGEAGKFSAMFGGWTSGPGGSIITSRRIEDMP